MTTATSPAGAPADTFFPAAQRAHIIEHMNDDHADAVLNYAHHFGGATEAASARLDDIDQFGLDLTTTAADGATRRLRISFAAPLATPAEAHHTLIAMARTARGAAPEPGTPSQADRRHAALERARASAAELRRSFKSVLLGTVSAEGEPDASVAPAVLGEDGAFFTYVSALSTHTGNLLYTGRASVLLIEDEAVAQHLLARRRLTLACTATPIARDAAAFAPAMGALKEKYGAVMQTLEQMHDFQLVRLDPTRARLVAGFGQAYDVDPHDWTLLSHVGDTGHAHGTAAAPARTSNIQLPPPNS